MHKLRAPVAMLLLAAAACGSKPNPLPSPSPSHAKVRPSSTAQLEIVDPAAGASFAAGTVHVKLELTGATIVPQTSTNLKPDEGHIHLSLDGKIVSMTYGLEQDVPAAKGEHLLTAEFVATDHFPFNPRVVATTTFVVT